MEQKKLIKLVLFSLFILLFFVFIYLKNNTKDYFIRNFPPLSGAIDTFYTHQDIMRDFISDTQGDAITQTCEAGRVIRKVYKKVLDYAWKAQNVKIVAFVHEYQNSKVVYQGKEIDVQ